MEFDPLAVENVGVTLAVELLEQKLLAMPPNEPFPGAGVYALYYSGRHPAYDSLLRLDAGRFKYPVYIGKAAGESAKQGFNPHGSSKRRLFDRISQHAASIEAVRNLSVDDFQCRVLILNDAYIALAEAVMIRLFRPPWNGMSFGSKVVGRYRMTGKPPLWDSLHPGRSGRPEGSDERAEQAESVIAKRIAELDEDISDPIIRRMYQRIMKFV
jgi:hypothetical protein